MERERTTEELRRAQLERELEERDQAEHGSTEDETEQHARRADKASYLKRKLEERARSEHAASRIDERR